MWILVSMFLALGASTLLNTTVNILTPAVFAGYAAQTGGREGAGKGKN